jgi:hypothetical protein
MFRSGSVSFITHMWFVEFHSENAYRNWWVENTPLVDRSTQALLKWQHNVSLLEYKDFKRWVGVVEQEV